MKHKYQINLTTEERKKLLQILSKGKTSARLVKRANILLALDGKDPNQRKLAEELHTTAQTIIRVSKEYLDLGFEKTMQYRRNPIPPISPIIDGEAEARILQIACSEAPAGHSRWSLKMIAAKAMELHIVEHVCPETIRKALKKTKLNRT